MDGHFYNARKLFLNIFFELLLFKLLKLIFLKKAIPNIFRTNHILIKVIWILAFIISAGLCGYMVYGSIVNYLQFGVVTGIRVNSENPMTFPTISMCNLNPNVTYESYNIMENIINFYFGLNSSNILNGIPKIVVINSTYQLWERYFVPRYIATSDFVSQSESFKKMLGLPFKKFVINCFFGFLPCYEDDFTWWILFY